MRSRELTSRPTVSDSNRLIIILANPFLFETKDSALQSARAFAKLHQIHPPYQVIQHELKIKNVPMGTLIVSDQVGRLVRNGSDLTKWLRAIVEKDILVLLPECDLRETAPDIQARKQIIQFLASVPTLIQSIKIREGLSIRKFRGFVNGRAPISNEVKAIVISEYASKKSIRSIACSLKDRGINISKSKVGQILKDRSTGGI